MCSQEDMEYYGRFDDRDPPPEPIMICDNCSEPFDVCMCITCRHCGDGGENISIVNIKCPVVKCEDEGDKVCISCKNTHDQRHQL